MGAANLFSLIVVAVRRGRLPFSMDQPMNVSEPEAASPASPSTGFWKAVPGCAIAALCLVWVFHDIEIRSVIGALSAMNWWWVAAAMSLDVLSYLFQGKRWSLLVHPSGSVSTMQATRAIYAGLFVNGVLPMRLGEVLRIVLVSRWTETRVATIVPSVLVERFLDTLWLALAFGITVLSVPLPKYLVGAEGALGFTALAATVLLVYMALPKRAKPSTLNSGAKDRGPVVHWISGLWNVIGVGISEIGRSRHLYSSFAFSALLLIGQTLSYWLVMVAYGLRLSFWHGVAVFLIVHVGTAIPSAPSNVGTFQFFTVVGLTLFGVDKTVATGFSVVVFLALTIPLWLIGMAVFGRLGLSLKRIRTEMASLAGRWNPPATPAKH